MSIINAETAAEWAASWLADNHRSGGRTVTNARRFAECAAGQRGISRSPACTETQAAGHIAAADYLDALASSIFDEHPNEPRWIRIPTV